MLPALRFEVVITSGAGSTAIENGAVVDTPAASLTFTVKLLVPGAVGVPEIVAPSRVKPRGKLPLAIDHVYGAVPPLAEIFCEYAVPAFPAGNDVVVITSGAAFTVIDNACVAVTDALSVTFTVKVLVPDALGVPEIVDPVNVSPAGNDPVAIDHVYGVVPPLAFNPAEYELLTVPLGNDVVVIVSAAAFTVIDTACVAVADALSVT